MSNINAESNMFNTCDEASDLTCSYHVQWRPQASELHC